MAEYGFVLTGAALPAAGDLLGVWSVPPEPAAVSFEAQAPADPAWQIVLPGDLVEADVILDRQALALQHSEQALEQAELRLERLGRAVEGVAFAAPDSPESRLLADLDRLQSPVVFGLFGREDAEQRSRLAGWLSFMDGVRNLVSRYANVETTVAGARVGWTTVSWTGHFDTRWASGITPASMTLHCKSVHLALASRVALMRMIAVVAAGAANIGWKLSIPGGQLLALPAVWQFVQDVLREWRGWQAQVAG